MGYARCRWSRSFRGHSFIIHLYFTFSFEYACLELGITNLAGSDKIHFTVVQRFLWLISHPCDVTWDGYEHRLNTWWGHHQIWHKMFCSVLTIDHHWESSWKFVCWRIWTTKMGMDQNVVWLLWFLPEMKTKKNIMMTNHQSCITWISNQWFDYIQTKKCFLNNMSKSWSMSKNPNICKHPYQYLLLRVYRTDFHGEKSKYR